MKRYLTTAVFSFILIFFCTGYFVSQKSALSLAERRALADIPVISQESIESGDFFDGLDDFLTDNIIFRDALRSIKARFQTYVLGMKENNSIACENGYFSKIEKRLNVASMNNLLSKCDEIYNLYLSGKNTKNRISVIPDKGYFFAKEFGYPSLDYGAVSEAFKTYERAEYIDLFGALSLDDYYKTDTHWSQNKLLGVLRVLGEKMGFKAAKEYDVSVFSPFYGVYCGQSALSPAPDTIYYLTNEVINACAARDLETGEEIRIYDFDAAGGGDGYDLFLGGTRGVIKIESPLADSEREIVVFKDSYGSSLAPLLACSYKAVILVDTRLIYADKIGEYVDFSDKDVLFLYSVLSVQNSFSMR